MSSVYTEDIDKWNNVSLSSNQKVVSVRNHQVIREGTTIGSVTGINTIISLTILRLRKISRNGADAFFMWLPNNPLNVLKTLITIREKYTMGRPVITPMLYAQKVSKRRVGSAEKIITLVVFRITN
jgi:hypothetical protein